MEPEFLNHFAHPHARGRSIRALPAGSARIASNTRDTSGTLRTPVGPRPFLSCSRWMTPRRPRNVAGAAKRRFILIDTMGQTVHRRLAKAGIANDCTGRGTCDALVHAPRFVRKGGLPCGAYCAWLNRETKRLRTRDKGWFTQPPADAYIVALHQAVLLSQGRDCYTGHPLQWRLLARPRRTTTGRRRHIAQGRRPSVDHLNGTHQLAFRMCEANVNEAKGPMSHQQFVKLCKAVADHHDAAPDLRRPLQPPSWWRFLAWWRFTQPMKARCQSAGVRS